MSKLDALLKIVEMLETEQTQPLATLEKERPVVVFTDKRGVFYGYTSASAIGTVRLKSARLCHYWASNEGVQRGVLGLASHGPAPGSKITSAANIELTGVTCIAECTDEAAKQWESSTWSD